MGSLHNISKLNNTFINDNKNKNKNNHECFRDLRIRTISSCKVEKLK